MFEPSSRQFAYSIPGLNARCAAWACLLLGATACGADGSSPSMDSATPTGNPAPGGATAGGAGPDGSGAATFPGGSGSAGDAADPSAERDAGDASGEVGDGVADAGTDAASGTDTGAARSACEAVVGDPNVNWRDTSLQTDQEIVACLADSLGRPVGFGERALGGFDPDGGSRLIVITRGDDVSVEEQLESAVADDGHAWIVFDKRDFAEPTDVALYRLRCGDAGVQAALGVDDPALCLDHEAWCAARGVAAVDCLETFFNDRLDDGDLPIRNVRIGSNTTLDGRQSQARILFSGFAIGADSGGEPTTTADSVIVTNLLFRGAGHTEDHGLDPDMLRVTGASHDVWIHQNTFDLTGDSAFDVKVGAHDITISFNRVQNVKRASLHGSSDSREINAQITTTIHHNAFITTDDYYDTFGNTGRRVPLIRRGRSHMFNNVFYGYRKDVLSVRVGARVAFEDSLFLANPDIIGDDDLEYFTEELLADFREGGLEVSGSHVALSDGAYRIVSEPADLSASFGSTPDMLADYDQASRDTIAAHRMAAGQDLVDYVMATTGKGGTETFNAGP